MYHTAEKLLPFRPPPGDHTSWSYPTPVCQRPSQAFLRKKKWECGRKLREECRDSQEGGKGGKGGGWNKWERQYVTRLGLLPTSVFLLINIIWKHMTKLCEKQTLHLAQNWQVNLTWSEWCKRSSLLCCMIIRHKWQTVHVNGFNYLSRLRWWNNS